jgi:glutamate-1-semialdehyde 2,1-aminomutase
MAEAAMTTAVGSRILAEYERRTPRSRAAYERALRTIPGGLVQGSRFYAPYPITVARGEGPCIWDLDGNRYVDYFQAATAQFLGHSHPAIIAAVERHLRAGTNFGLHYELEAQVAERLRDFVPSAERVTFTNTGMDACLLGLRVARARTGRAKIATFRGHFHGWEDQLYAGYARGIGIPAEVQANTRVLPYNDLGALAQAMESERFAAVILEPYSTNAGAIPPARDFLPTLRQLTRDHGAALIFDEVVTNFRLARGGAQELFGVVPDLTALGKPLGGRFVAVGALVGAADWLDMTDHRRGDYVYHGCWQNPVAMAAIMTTLDLLADGTLIAHANRLGDELRAGLNELFRREGAEGQAVGLGSAVRVFMIGGPIRGLDDVKVADKELLALFHFGLVNRGHFMLPGKNTYTSVVQTSGDIDRFLDDSKMALREAMEERARA